MTVTAALGIWFFGTAFTFGYLSVRHPGDDAVHIMVTSTLWPVIVLGAIPGMLGAALGDTLKRRSGK